MSKNITVRQERGARIGLVLALVASLAAAPGVGAQEVDPQRLAALMQRIDPSGLQPIGEVLLPPSALERDAFTGLDPARAGPAVTGESFGPPAGSGRRLVSKSPSFSFEWLPGRGSILVLQHEDSTRSQPVEGGFPGLLADARSKLAALGIGPGEIGQLALRRLLAQAHDGQETSPPRLVAHKVFVERAIGGIPVVGARSVATYGPDLSFRKLLLHWPGLAGSGHVLSTGLAPEQIAENVARTLIRTGEDDGTGPISLRWVFESVPAGPAEVRLQLRVEATLLGAATPDELAESSGQKTRVRLFEPGGAGELVTDADFDGTADDADNCPAFGSADLRDTDGDGRGDACECGDQDGDGRNTVADIVAINRALFDPSLATDLCDANNDERCDVRDLVAVNQDLFTPTSDTTCSRQPFAGP